MGPSSLPINCGPSWRRSSDPLRGEAHDDLLPALRHLALDRAVYWFRPRAEQRESQVMAVFFGGQDHQRRMLVRLLQNSFQV